MTYEQFVQVIMPTVFCPEDGKWIQEQLQQLAPSLRRKVVVKYAEAYQVAFYTESVSYRQENKAARSLVDQNGERGNKQHSHTTADKTISDECR